jgi:sugar O-acyltransferase (sialic acid O-acetyltransferase NeuD family)
MKIVLFGVGSPIVVEYVESCRRMGWSIVAAIKNRDGENYFENHTAVIDVASIAPELRAYSCVCPLFTPANRAAATREATLLGFGFEKTLIDPSAVTSSTTRIGEGSYINAACIIGAEASISRHVSINRGASVGHHVQIEQCASIGPGAIVGAFALIGKGAMIGMGAILLPKVKVGAFAMVGAGALVTRDVPSCAKVLGHPARIVETGLPQFELPDAAP